MTSDLNYLDFIMTPSNSENSAPQFPNENHLFNIEGFLQTLTEAPTAKPRKLSDQLVIVVAGGSSAVYIYDTVNLAWRYSSLT